MTDEVEIEEVEDEVIDSSIEEETLNEALSRAFDEQTKDEPTEEVETDVKTEAKSDVEAEVSPPEHWPDEAKTAFRELDERGRKFALSREQDFSKGIEEKSKELKKFRDSIKPYEHLFQGAAPEQAIQQLLHAQDYLNRSPVEGIKWLMKSYGVDEKQFATPAPDEYVDPEIKSLREELTQLKKGAEDRAREAETRRQRAMLAEISNFRDATDEQGSPKHPHFNAVQGVMAGLLTAGRAKDMDDAYEQAVWAIPEYRDSVVENLAKERAQKELEEKLKKTQNAKQSAKTVQGKTSAKTTSKPKTLGDSLAENYEKSIRGEL